MEITQRDRRACIYGGIGLGVILIYVLAIEPAIVAYDELISEHRALTGRTAKIMRDNKKAAYLSQRISQWEEKTGTPTDPKRYSEQITAMSDRIMTAGQCGVKIKNSAWVAPKPWSDDPRLAMAQVQLEAEGDWERLCTFLGNLHRTDGIFSVEQMDLSTGTRRDGRANLKLTLSVLVQAEPQAKGRANP